MKKALTALAALGGSAVVLLTTLPTQAATLVATATKAKTYTGTSVSTPFGPVQVEVTVTGKKITKATAVTYPNMDRKSQMINTYAIPHLEQQAVTVQSANVDGVSGASWSTYGFKTSLQAALVKAGLAKAA